MPKKRSRTTVTLTENEEKSLRFFFQEKEDESLSTLIRKAMRDGIMVESIHCKVDGNGKYTRLSADTNQKE